MKDQGYSDVEVLRVGTNYRENFGLPSIVGAVCRISMNRLTERIQKYLAIQPFYTLLHFPEQRTFKTSLGMNSVLVVERLQILEW